VWDGARAGNPVTAGQPDNRRGRPRVRRPWAGIRYRRGVTEDAGARDQSEAAIHDRCRAGDHAAACTLAIETYGRELFGYLNAVANDPEVATDAYGQLALVLWQSLPGFRWDASLRTWLYALARSSLSRITRRPEHRRPHIALDAASAEGFAAAVRTRTAEYLRTETRDAVTEIRDALSEEDRAILILRVDRGLDWSEIARITLVEDDVAATAPVPAAIAREAARLRKRFERIKETIRERVRPRG